MILKILIGLFIFYPTLYALYKYFFQERKIPIFQKYNSLLPFVMGVVLAFLLQISVYRANAQIYGDGAIIYLYNSTFYGYLALTISSIFFLFILYVLTLKDTHKKLFVFIKKMMISYQVFFYACIALFLFNEKIYNKFLYILNQIYKAIIKFDFSFIMEIINTYYTSHNHLIYIEKLSLIGLLFPVSSLHLILWYSLTFNINNEKKPNFFINIIRIFILIMLVINVMMIGLLIFLIDLFG